MDFNQSFVQDELTRLKVQCRDVNQYVMLKIILVFVSVISLVRTDGFSHSFVTILVQRWTGLVLGQK